MVYIDDYNSIEKVDIAEAESHISVHKRKLRVIAKKSEAVFNEVQTLAADKKMKVNCKKTQLLCVSSSLNNEVGSYIRTNEGEIDSTSSLKILGFNFNTEPNANYHVTGLINKFYGKLWTLRFLKKSGMYQNALLGIYCDVICPSAEYSSIIYNTLIPEYVSDRLESVQKQAMKIIFGFNIDYANLVENGTIEPLKVRRTNASLAFALKASQLPRFQYWFKQAQSWDREVRQTTRRTYVERKCRTERDRNNPLNAITRQLNAHLANI